MIVGETCKGTLTIKLVWIEYVGELKEKKLPQASIYFWYLYLLDGPLLLWVCSWCTKEGLIVS